MRGRERETGEQRGAKGFGMAQTEVPSQLHPDAMIINVLTDTRYIIKIGITLQTAAL